MSRLSDALDAVRFARTYTRGLLDTIPEADWFRMPAGVSTHVAWQVGHLAFAHYRLGLLLVRGQRPDDADLLPPAFHTLFGRETVADPDPAKYPPLADIRAVFDRLHAHLLAELADYPDADLDGPTHAPARVPKTRLESVRWCAAHEMLHAGQIGLLRRLFGMPPIW